MILHLFLTYIFLATQVLHCQSTDLASLVSTIQKDIAQEQAAFSAFEKLSMERFASLEKDIAQFEVQDQKNFSDQLATGKNRVKEALQKSSQAINDIYNQFQKQLQMINTQFNVKTLTLLQAQTQLEKLRIETKNSMQKESKRVTARTEQTLSELTNLIEKNKQEKTVKQVREGIKKESSQLKEQQKKFFAVWQTSNAQMPQFIGLENQARTLLTTQFQQGNVDLARFGNLISSYKEFLRKFSKIYAAHTVELSFNDKSNNVALVLQRLMNIFLNEAALTIAVAQRPTQKRDFYYQLLASLAKRFNGSKDLPDIVRPGYATIIDTLAQEYFPQEYTAINALFCQQRSDLMLSPYQRALQDLVSYVSNPEEKHVSYAKLFYQEIMNDIPCASKITIQNREQNATENMAHLMVARAQTVMQNLSLQEDNTTQWQIIIDAYQQAAGYYQRAGNAEFADRYQNVAAVFLQAIGYWQEAQKAKKNADIAMPLYQKAQQSFMQIGNAVDAHKANVLYHTFMQEKQEREAQRIMNAFMQEHQNQFQEYLLFLNEAADSLSFAQINSFLSLYYDASMQTLAALNTAYASAVFAEKDTASLKMAVNALKAVTSMLKYLRNGDTALQNAPLQEIYGILLHYYQPALLKAQAIDALFEQESALSVYLPLYTRSFIQSKELAGTEWSYIFLVHRHSAKAYLQKSTTLTVGQTALLSFYALQNSRDILSAGVQERITKNIEALVRDETSFTAFKNELSQETENALRLGQQDWVADTTKKEYSSRAYLLWQDIIQRYTFIYSHDKKIINAYITALLAYIKAFEAYAPASFYPTISIIPLYYRLYVLSSLHNDQAALQAILKQTESSMKSFIDIVQKLEQALQKAPTLDKAVEEIKNIQQALRFFDQALTEQTLVKSLFENNEITGFLKKEETNQEILYGIEIQGHFTHGTLPPISLLYAKTYEQFAYELFKKNEYKDAYPAYKKAYDYYQQLGDQEKAEEVNTLYQLSYTRAIANAYRDLVLPNQKEAGEISLISVAGINVPFSYQLANYLQQIPAEIPIPLVISDALKNSLDQKTSGLQNSLVDIAGLLFVYNLLQDAGIAYNKVFAGIQPIANPDISITQKTLLSSILEQANNWQQYLKKDVELKKTWLSIQEKDKLFYLGQHYAPIFAVAPIPSIPMTQLPYSRFPTAMQYYPWVQKLYDPTQTTIQFGTQILQSGHDAAIAQTMQEKMGKAFLSAGSALVRRVEALQNKKGLTEIDPLMDNEEQERIANNKKLMGELSKAQKKNAALENYISVYMDIKDYLQSGAVIYFDTAAQYYQKINPKIAQDIKALIGQAYRQLATIGQSFLIGDPLSPYYFYGSRGVYGGVLWDIKRYYDIASGYLGAQDRDADINTVAHLFTNAGSLLVKEKKYVASIIYWVMALAAYNGLQKKDLAKSGQAALQLFNAYYQGSLDSLKKYQNAHKKGVVLEGETISLATLIERYQNFVLKVEGQKLYLTLQEAILDAALYYRDCSTQAGFLANALNSANTDAVKKETESIVSAFLQKNNINVSEPTSIIAWLTRDDFVQSLKIIFNQATQFIEKNTPEQQVYGYLLMQGWCNQVFMLLGQLYMYDFLASMQSSDQFLQWMQALKVEEQEILAPAQQWFS